MFDNYKGLSVKSQPLLTKVFQYSFKWGILSAAVSHYKSL